jgi:hypothetical protein
MPRLCDTFEARSGIAVPANRDNVDAMLRPLGVTLLETPPDVPHEED